MAPVAAVAEAEAEAIATVEASEEA
jgi:hypothetical protein